LTRIYYAAKEIIVETEELEDEKILEFLKNDKNKYDTVFVFTEKSDGFDLERAIELSKFYTPEN
jgi:hypothetical protein